MEGRRSLQLNWKREVQERNDVIFLLSTLSILWTFTCVPSSPLCLLPRCPLLLIHLLSPISWPKLLRAADRFAYRLWKHCLFCRDCLERRDIYILLALALLCWRRPVSPHWRSPRRLTGDHPVNHALPGLTPSTANFPTKINLHGKGLEAKSEP